MVIWNYNNRFKKVIKSTNRGTTSTDAGYEVLLKETDLALVPFEMDLYWVVRAGHDPVKLFEAHPGRFVLWHVKDMDKVKPERNTAVGSGSVNFKRIFEYQKLSGVKHIYMEHKRFSIDAYQSITQSSRYIKILCLNKAYKFYS